jgi:hypothetical protein
MFLTRMLEKCLRFFFNSIVCFISIAGSYVVCLKISKHFTFINMLPNFYMKVVMLFFYELQEFFFITATGMHFSRDM